MQKRRKTGEQISAALNCPPWATQDVMQLTAKHRAELKLPPIAALRPMEKKKRRPTVWTLVRSLSAIAEQAAEEEASLTVGKIVAN